MKFSTVVAAAIVVFLTLFTLANWRPADIYLLPGVWVGQMRLSLALIFAAGLGFATAVLVRMAKKDRK